MAVATAEKTKDVAVATAKKTKEVVSTTGEVITDSWITTKLKAKFVDESLLKDSDINVDTNDHVVTLKGTVMSSAGQDARGGNRHRYRRREARRQSARRQGDVAERCTQTAARAGLQIALRLRREAMEVRQGRRHS